MLSQGRGRRSGQRLAEPIVARQKHLKALRRAVVRLEGGQRAEDGQGGRVTIVGVVNQYDGRFVGSGSPRRSQSSHEFGRRIRSVDGKAQFGTKDAHQLRRPKLGRGDTMGRRNDVAVRQSGVQYECLARARTAGEQTATLSFGDGIAKGCECFVVARSRKIPLRRGGRFERSASQTKYAAIHPMAPAFRLRNGIRFRSPWAVSAVGDRTLNISDAGRRGLNVCRKRGPAVVGARRHTADRSDRAPSAGRVTSVIG